MLPLINLTLNNNIRRLPEDGSLVYKYAPFYNLRGDDIELKPLRLDNSKSNIDINKSLELNITPSYDNSANILINDRVNPLKLVNSRFYLDNSKSYKIADRKGSVDTNIYSEDNFINEVNFIKPVNSVHKLDFLGIEDGGNFPVGNYHFYFKLVDSDGNESDFVAESSLVTCHIGSTNTPTAIRGGQLNENSEKLIKFRLKNIDLSYSYISIYYSRKSGSELSDFTEVFKINNKFKITNVNTEITITGFEDSEKLDISTLNTKYAEFSTVQSGENCQNITFVGNTTKNYEIYKTLEKYSLGIVPSISTELGIGNLSPAYSEMTTEEFGHEYYNVKNTYYKLGYWDEEIYRFGVVYIMNDYSLSPVFNIRGIKELKKDTVFRTINIDKPIEYGEDYFILNSSHLASNPENVKGLFKINNDNYDTFDVNKSIKPIGLKFKIQATILDGTAKSTSIKNITKGFFIVRQKRIPTIISQGISIATTKKTNTPALYGTLTNSSGQSVVNYFSESFLTAFNGKPKLGRSMFEIPESEILNNALLCPEASLQSSFFKSYFNSSNFTLRRTKYTTGGTFSDTSNENKNRLLFALTNIGEDRTAYPNILADLLLVTPDIKRIKNQSTIFSSRCGDAQIAWESEDPIWGNVEDLADNQSSDTDSSWTNSVSRIRGMFNTYIGTTSSALARHQIYNIFQKDYNYDNWKSYFKVRFTNQSSYFPVGDRCTWEDVQLSGYYYITPAMYGGDCYINTYTHRMLWNFIDPELPTTTKIIDKWTWYRNYKVKTTSLKAGKDGVWDVTQSGPTGADVSYKKILELFTYDNEDLLEANVVLVDGAKFEKFSEENGLYGVSKMNRPDINAVKLGHWATFKVCSNINLCFRDIDFSQSSEESIHNMKRSFYPLQGVSLDNRLPEASLINKGLTSYFGNKYYFELPDVPFIKTINNTRIYYSNVLQESNFKNGNRIFQDQNYQDYTNEYGSIVKLIEWNGVLIVVLEHGVLSIPINERALMANTSGENVYINTENVLPKNPNVLSNSFGSLWADSVVKTNRFIYGIDTIGKKIWKTDGKSFYIISDLKIQKFLNNNMEITKAESIGINKVQFVKTHFNAFKSDVLFVINYGETTWNLCWNELLEKWITRYTWFPEFSENINNIFYTFANETKHSGKGGYLYKHGFAGDSEESIDINPTKWYDTQEFFEFEFVVNGNQGTQKIFDNLKIISNAVPPDSFYYEVIGDSFNWAEDKANIHVFTTDEEFLEYLTENIAIKKVPYIKYQNNFLRDRSSETLVKDISLEQDSKLKNISIRTYQKGLEIKKSGRLKGNMDYTEDFWDVQIQPISFKYAYLRNNLLTLTDSKEMKIRDKFLKIRIRYNGEKYAIINSLLTLFTVSYA